MAGSPEAKAFATASKTAKAATCHYCAGQLCSEATDIIGGLTGDPHRRFMCLPCRVEFYRVAQVRFDGGIERLATRKELLEAVRVIGHGVEKHMREWITRRDL
jgi:hypothetical protein